LDKGLVMAAASPHHIQSDARIASSLKKLATTSGGDLLHLKSGVQCLLLAHSVICCVAAPKAAIGLASDEEPRET
jgi:hypothetical protein